MRDAVSLNFSIFRPNRAHTSNVIYGCSTMKYANDLANEVTQTTGIIPSAWAYKYKQLEFIE